MKTNPSLHGIKGALSEAPAARPVSFRALQSDDHAGKPEAGIRLNRKTLKPVIALATLGLLACVTTLQAQTTWNGAVDNDWHNVDNWSSGLPGAGNIPLIRNAGNVVNLTQNVTIGGSGEFVRLDSRSGTGAPATLNISANLDLGTNAFEIGSRFLSDPSTGYYQAVVKQTAGVVDAGLVRMALRGGTLEAPPSEYNISGGTLNATQLLVSEGAASATAAGTFRQTGGVVNVGGNLFLSASQGRGVYLMEDGALNVTGGEFLIAERSTTNPTFHQTGGTVSMTDMGLSRISWRNATSGSAIGTMILEGGSFSFASNNSYFAIAERATQMTGTLVKYGAADVSFSTTSTTEAALYISRSGNAPGTLRAVIDQTGFDAIKLNSANIALSVNGPSTLQIALAGGVMMSGSNAFQIIDNQTGTVDGTWLNGPNALWNATTSTAVGVQAELNPDDLRGTLNASAIGNAASLTGPSSVGYIEVSNFDTAKQLRLDMVAASVGGSNLDGFIADLAAAGYSPVAFGPDSVVITLDPALNGAGYFAWDLRAYTHNDEPLQIEAITVVTVESPRITAFSYNSADGSAQATIEGGVPNARFKLVESAILDFSNPDRDPVPLLSATTGTLIDGFYVIANENGVATVQFNLGTGPATFVRAETTGIITIAEFDFEVGGQDFTPSGDWAWGTPASDNGLVDGLVTGGNGGSTGAWATALGDGGEPINGGITPSVESILTSPNIVLTGITGARLEFAAAVDAAAGDTLEVLVRNATGDALLQTITPFPNGFPADAQWQDLGPFQLAQDADDKTIYLEFRYVGTVADYLGFYLDDVKISF